jgi:rod shape-determining protein MreC
LKRRKGPNRLYVATAVLIVLGVILSSLYVREKEAGPLHSVESFFRDQLAGPLTFLKNTYSSFEDWFYGVLNASRLTRENEKLKRDLSEARRLLLEAEAVKRENEELKKMLKLPEKKGFSLIAAEIIAVNQEMSGKFYTINRGREDGLEINQPVITPDGIFGKIYSVGKRSAYVMPINHPQSAVSAEIAETGEKGILEGTAEGELKLKLIPRDSKASIGMTVVTSGLGGIFPKNLLLGTIKSVKGNPNRLDLEIAVGAAVDFNTTDFVYVVLTKEEPRGDTR